MGNSINSYFIYAREIQSDRYADEPICELSTENHTVEACFGCYKREVYCFCLDKEHYKEIKSIYFYENGWRLSKCTRGQENATFQLTFRSKQYKDQFETSQECLGPKKWPLVERQFLSKREIVHNDDTQSTFRLMPL